MINIDFEKYTDGLVPAIIQDQNTSKVLMLGYMNKEALNKTLEMGKVTFFSRSRKRLWTKGEESGNFLEVKSIASDCDQDADRKSTRLNSRHIPLSRMPSSA